MANIQRGSLRLFQFAGVDVFLHWSWFLVAVFEIGYRAHDYSSLGWNALEYLALFLVVLMHEFGHALACKQVGGVARHIMLWPLGGVAYILPPQRPGAILWSMAAGPLVNVAQIAALLALGVMNGASGWARLMPNTHRFLLALLAINLLLLVFNILPIYPLDGGQILRALLWYLMGRIPSLFVATLLGMAGAGGLIVVALVRQSFWIWVIAAFMLVNCVQGLKQALHLSRANKAPRRKGVACPVCKKEPPLGDFWICAKCKKPFDTFQTQATCPRCSNRFSTTMCIACGALRPMAEWVVREAPAAPAPAPAPAVPSP